MQNKKLNVLSLFSGCGGMDLGFEGGFNVLKKSINLVLKWKVKNVSENWVMLPKTSFKTVFANDIRSDAKRAYEEYFSKRESFKNNYWLDSIVDLVKRHKNGESIFPGLIDVVTGGFPCQDFSVAGKRQGFNSKKGHNGKLAAIDAPSIENRGQLYMWMREVISIVHPKVFVAENVKGLVSLEDAKAIIEHDFSTVGDGYIVMNAKVLHAAEYGVPQSRERVIFIGFNKNFLKKEALESLSDIDNNPKYNPYPQPTHHLDDGNHSFLLNKVTALDAFVDLEEPNNSTDESQKAYSKAKFYGKHCQGQTEVKLNDIAPTIRSEHHGNIEYRRLSEEHGGKHINELKSGLLERRLTVRECARIQTFPDDYQFILPKKDGVSVSASGAYKIIGNALPPLLAYHIAKRLEYNWHLYFD